MFTTVANLVKGEFDGMLVVGDVHGDYASLLKAFAYAASNNYFFMSLGDLVDRGPHPYYVVQFMYDSMKDDSAGFTIGNHDHKFRRYATGANVSFSKDGKDTLASVGEDRMADFLKMYTEIVEHPRLSGYFHKFDDISLVHAAYHPHMHDHSIKFTKSVESRMIVGETNGEVYDDGYPVRLYNWMDEVPMGKTVIVGHDKMPIHNINITEPMIVTNKNGGKTVFMDTGCGKGGFLSGAVVLNNKGTFKLVDFKEFK